MDVHHDAMAVAAVAQAHGAEVTSLGALGTRQCDSDPRVRTMPSKAPPRLFVDAAGPWGDWLTRELTKHGDDGGVVAPSLLPHPPGARVNPDRRDARPRARLARSGALPVVDVPKGEAEALRDRSRARDETLSARTDATGRRQAC
jgi:transposase